MYIVVSYSFTFFEIPNWLIKSIRHPKYIIDFFWELSTPNFFILQITQYGCSQTLHAHSYECMHARKPYPYYDHLWRLDRQILRWWNHHRRLAIVRNVVYHWKHNGVKAPFGSTTTYYLLLTTDTRIGLSSKAVMKQWRTSSWNTLKTRSWATTPRYGSWGHRCFAKLAWSCHMFKPS